MAYLTSELKPLLYKSNDPGAIRLLLSAITGIENVGLLRKLQAQSQLIFLASADRYRMHILAEDSSILVGLNEGPVTIRFWSEDSPEEIVENTRNLIEVYSFLHERPRALAYRFTEHSSFVWRPAFGQHLSRIKRRNFVNDSGEVYILHSRQSDTEDGERLEYFLQSPQRIWRNVQETRRDNNGEVHSEMSEYYHESAEVTF